MAAAKAINKNSLFIFFSFTNYAFGFQKVRKGTKNFAYMQIKLNFLNKKSPEGL